MIKRYFLIICLLLFFVTGCGRFSKNVIIFNDEAFSKDNFNQVKTGFYAGERIYYLFASPDKFKAPYIRVQVSSVTDKVHTLFYKPIWSGDYRLMKDEVYYYTNYFVLHQKGKYLVQVFRMDDLHHPLAFAFITVD